MLKETLKIIALPLSLTYGFIQLIRRLLYGYGLLKQEDLPGRCISIGNLEVGGTGKSPVTIAIAQELIAQGHKPAIVTRGYRSGLSSDEFAVIKGEQCLIAPQRTKDFAADEARMQSSILKDVPVIIGSNRVAACRAFLGKFDAPSHWLLDDGFQHLKIRRDLDLVLLDANRPLDNKLTMPSGRLREFPFTLKWASRILLTRSEDEIIPNELRRHAEKISFSQFTNRSLELVHSSAGEKGYKQDWNVLLVSGIAKPEQLHSRLTEQGINIKESYFVPDHHHFDRKIIVDKSRHLDAIICTEKDYYRDPQVFKSAEIPVFTSPLHADIASIRNFL